MRYLVLASDYDGTLAHDGRVNAATIAALQRLRASGRLLILVTGRELEELLEIFPEASIFERIVAENGAIVYHPATRQTTTLAPPPSQRFVDALRQAHVAPLSVGRVIVATWKPHETTVLEAIRDLGLELQVIFNKNAVMVLPSGINKATGLAAALKELELSPHEVVGVGDAENDVAFLSCCECAVAVQNALPAVKERVDMVTAHDHGRGVEELIERLLDNDLDDSPARHCRHDLLFGHRESGDEVRLPAYCSNLLIAGPSSSGKSTISKSFLERLQERQYQFLIIDPEGDYEGLEGAVTIGSSKQFPVVDEVLQQLKRPDTNLVINLLGVPLADRPPFFLALWPRLQEARARSGRPHWIVVDEAHHLLPAAWVPGQEIMPRELDRMAFITVHPDQVAAAALKSVTTVIAVGAEPGKVIARFCEAVGEMSVPNFRDSAAKGAASELQVDAKPGDVVIWPRRERRAPFRVAVVPARSEHRRHIRKYAEAELPPHRCFYFRGKDGKLNLKVHNLTLFNQIGDGVDDSTWLYHLRRGDFSRWFGEGIHDETLASEAAKIEKAVTLSASDSRKSIRELIERFYTMPATTAPPMPGTYAESAAEAE